MLQARGMILVFSESGSESCVKRTMDGAAVDVCGAKATRVRPCPRWSDAVAWRTNFIELGTKFRVAAYFSPIWNFAMSAVVAMAMPSFRFMSMEWEMAGEMPNAGSTGAFAAIVALAGMMRVLKVNGQQVISISSLTDEDDEVEDERKLTPTIK